MSTEGYAQNKANPRKRKVIEDTSGRESPFFHDQAKNAYLGTTDINEKEERGTSVVFSLSEDVGVLADVLSIFKTNQVNLKHIESRPSKASRHRYDFFVDIDEHELERSNLVKAIDEIKKIASTVVLHHEEATPWFPRKISDLDRFADRTLAFGKELDADHPGFSDETYRERRKAITDNATSYRYGQPLPKIEYTAQEIATWKTAFTNLTELYPKYACKELNYILPLLIQNCGYGGDNIPQLEVVSNFLKECTGFTLRPVSGLLSSRDFLAGLAFRVFHATQYIRHHSAPMYTPEPDVVHELVGHCPMFADASFAQFSQEIGLASLGAPDDWIEKLATLYWFTIEFGLCKDDNGDVKAYGAGLLSSFGELQYSVSDKPELRAFEPEKTSVQEYPITQYQPVYFVAESFDDAKERLRAWSVRIPRPFTVRYNPYTACVETIAERGQLVNVVAEIKSEVERVMEALKRDH